MSWVSDNVYLSISTRFGRLCAHHEEKQFYLCDTWCLLFCMDDCLVCSVQFHSTVHTPDSHPYRVTSTKCLINTVVSPDDGHSRSKCVEIDKYTKNKLCTKLALFTRLYRDAWPTKHKIVYEVFLVSWIVQKLLWGSNFEIMTEI
jgi:hypothetical protein